MNVAYKASPNDGEPPQKRPKEHLGDTASSSDRPRFACPFYKRNPQKYSSELTCTGPGWTTTHRLKEHIYRRHVAPEQCVRCGLVMRSSENFSQHLMLQPACELREFKRAEGATPDQLRVLRSRKRSREEETEEVKWRMIYRILFPGDIIPSPYYYDYTFKKAAEFIREEQAGMLHSRIEDLLRSELGGLFEGERERIVLSMSGQIQKIIDESVNEAFNKYALLEMGCGIEGMASGNSTPQNSGDRAAGLETPDLTTQSQGV